MNLKFARRHAVEVCAYGCIPAGATTAFFKPISSNARRTNPEALASSTKAAT
jgi:hypothetical protein